ncbi:hypothetical protein JQ617_34780 [Bradyrhizobium sp. KB893862 SZCCT0404]|nr:hypothetical protein [Bradyrhizobium sp. KB893862 SZCCT0404]
MAPTTLASPIANRSMGARPGLIAAYCHTFRLDSSFSCSRSGSNPARTIDDLPLPELPTTAMKWLVRSSR